MKFTKAYLIAALLMVVSYTANAQKEIELQFHYDVGRFERNGALGDGTPIKQEIKRDDVRLRWQMIGRDSLGIYVLSGIFNYSKEEQDHINTGASLLALRGVKLSKKSHWEAVVGFNGSTIGGSNLYFAGIHHPLKFGKLVLLPALFYSYKEGDDNANMRFLMGYKARLMDKKLLIFGFVNYWTRDLFESTPFGGKKGGFQTNPQLYYNVTKQVALGTEIDISYHRYSPDDNLIVLPSASLRWQF